MKKFLLILLIMLASTAFASSQEYMNFKWWENFGDENLISNLQELYEKNYDLKNA